MRTVCYRKAAPHRSMLAREVAGMGHQWLSEGADPVGDLIQERAGEDKDEGLV